MQDHAGDDKAAGRFGESGAIRVDSGLADWIGILGGEDGRAGIVIWEGQRYLLTGQWVAAGKHRGRKICVGAVVEMQP
jgi:hypothetical protein